jgi:hypothetical protein
VCLREAAEWNGGSRCELLVTSAVNETAHISNEEFKKSLQEDAEIIGSSLHFIDDFSEYA